MQSTYLDNLPCESYCFDQSDYERFSVPHVAATAPADADDKCECQQPGHFCCGVPGILTHVENNRLAPGCKVERCDLCQRYPSDRAALEKLIELGMA